MKGIICLWSGAVVDIPEGWHLCDGAEGTPDLRDKFIVGAGSTYAPGNNGGASSHSHTIGISGTHLHSLITGTVFIDSSPAGNKANSTGITGGHTHTTQVVSHLPPYYALCYIMKL